MNFIESVLSLCAVIFTYQVLWGLFFFVTKSIWGGVNIDQLNNGAIKTSKYLFFAVILLKIIHLFFLISSIVLLINEFESANTSYISKFFFYLTAYIVLSLSFASANLKYYKSTSLELPFNLIQWIATISLGVLAFFPEILTYLLTNNLYSSIQSVNSLIIKIMSHPLIIIIVAVFVFKKNKRE